MASTVFTLLIALSTALLPTVNAQSCYFPNGTDGTFLKVSLASLCPSALEVNAILMSGPKHLCSSPLERED